MYKKVISLPSKHTITMCSFWFIKQVDRSIAPLVGIRGTGCDSSQHQRTSRTNSIQSTAIATHIYHNKTIVRKEVVRKFSDTQDEIITNQNL